jgi:cell division protease FtsH
MMGCVLLVVRYSILHQARTAPREVLYSDFVTLLDSGKVKAARLEASSSKLMFEMHPQEAAAAAGGAAAAAAAASAKASSSAAASSSKASAAAAAAAPAAAAAADAAAPAAPAPHRRFYIKLADKQDPLLVGKVLQAGGIHTYAARPWASSSEPGLYVASTPVGTRPARMFLVLHVCSNASP